MVLLTEIQKDKGERESTQPKWILPDGGTEASPCLHFQQGVYPLCVFLAPDGTAQGEKLLL